MAHAIEDYGRSRVSYSTPKTVSYSKSSTSNALKNSKTNTQTVNTSKKQDNTAVIYTPSKQGTPIKPATYSAPKPNLAVINKVDSAPKPNKVDQQVAASNKEAAKTSPNALSVAKNFFGGVYDAGKSTVEGVVNIVKHPVKTVEAIGSAVAHPVQTATAIKNAAVTTYNDFKNGDADVKAHMIGRLTGEVALAVVGTKGVDKAVKAVKGADAAADLSRLQKLADKATKTIEKLGDDAYSPAQLKAMAKNPKLEAPFKGTVIDKEFKALVEKDKVVGKKYEITTQGKAGPDLIYKKAKEWVDITTQKQAQKHIDKYTPKYGKGYIVTHK